MNKKKIQIKSFLYLFQHKKKPFLFRLLAFGAGYFPEVTWNQSYKNQEILNKPSKLKIENIFYKSWHVDSQIKKINLKMNDSGCLFPLVFTSRQHTHLKKIKSRLFEVSFEMQEPKNFVGNILKMLNDIKRNIFVTQTEMEVNGNFLNFICPIYKSKRTSFLIKFKPIKRSKVFQKFFKIDPASIDFDTKLENYFFVKNAMQSEEIKKINLDEENQSGNTLNYTIDFEKNKKFLAFFENIKQEFFLEIHQKCKVWIIYDDFTTTPTTEYKQDSDNNVYKFVPKDLEKNYFIYIYIEQSDKSEKNVDLGITFVENGTDVSAFFKNNWTYIVISALVLAIIFVVIFLRRKSKKAKVISKTRKSQQEEIAEKMKRRQLKKRKLSIFIKKNIHKLDGKHAH